MSQRKVVAKPMVTRHRRGRQGNVWVLDWLHELNGRHDDHARRALREAFVPRRMPVARKAQGPVRKRV